MRFQLLVRLASVCLASAAFAGCAPGLGNRIQLTPVKLPAESSQPVRFNSAGMRVQLRPFVDSRPSTAIAEVKGRPVEPSGDVAQLVQEAFENQLKSKGIETADPEAPIIGGQIETWQVNVLPSFPASEATAEATITVELSNIQNQVVYRGKYSGSTTIKHPLLNDSRIADALSLAMGYAIDEALKDDKLLDKISNTFHPIY